MEIILKYIRLFCIIEQFVQPALQQQYVFGLEP